MGDVSAALIPASLLLVFLGLLSAYSFYSIGRTCSEEKTNSLGRLGKKILERTPLRGWSHYHVSLRHLGLL